MGFATATHVAFCARIRPVEWFGRLVIFIQSTSLFWPGYRPIAAPGPPAGAPARSVGGIWALISGPRAIATRADLADERPDEPPCSSSGCTVRQLSIRLPFIQIQVSPWVEGSRALSANRGDSVEIQHLSMLFVNLNEYSLQA